MKERERDPLPENRRNKCNRLSPVQLQVATTKNSGPSNWRLSTPKKCSYT